MYVLEPPHFYIDFVEQENEVPIAAESEEVRVNAVRGFSGQPETHGFGRAMRDPGRWVEDPDSRFPPIALHIVEKIAVQHGRAKGEVRCAFFLEQCVHVDFVPLRVV